MPEDIIDIEQRLHCWIRDFVGSEKPPQFISDLKIILHENHRLREESPRPMINGIKVTVHGSELRTLCLKRAQHHERRSEAYAQQIDSMKTNQIEGMSYTNGDPIKALQDRKSIHDNEESELQFIADHLDLTEKYILDSSDLQKLGITKSRY